jgi:hypothetical protein
MAADKPGEASDETDAPRFGGHPADEQVPLRAARFDQRPARARAVRRRAGRLAIS